MIGTLLLATIAFCGNAAPQHQGENHANGGGHSMGRHLPGKDIRNFGEVTPMLYRGGQPSRDGLQMLAGICVGLVVNNGGRPNDGESKEVKRLGMKYEVIRWHCPFPQDKAFARFLRVVQDNPGKKIFIHCRLGDDRTGMMVASYRMAVEGWSAEDAMKEMQEFGFRGVHHLICPALASYEKHFPEHLKRNSAFEGLCSECGSEKAK